MRLSLCVSFCFALYFSMAFFGSTESSPSQTPNPNPDPNLNEDLKCFVKCGDFKALEESHVDLMDKFDSLSEKFDQLESKISEDDGISMLRPPLRGPPGPKGEKGDRGPIAPHSISSCTVALEIFPSPRSMKQVIYPHGNSKSVEVLCDFETDGGGWTLIQKRSSGPKQEFNRNWAEYKKGFGSLSGNFWLGLENIHALTINGDQELRIELEDHEGNKRWAKYSSFSVSDASDFYRLSLSGYSGDAGDSMTNSVNTWAVLNGVRFSTKDKDNDKSGGTDCAVKWGGGWWFNACHIANLNGLYREKGETFKAWQGIHWDSWKGDKYSLAKTEMKIRTRK